MIFSFDARSAVQNNSLVPALVINGWNKTHELEFGPLFSLSETAYAKLHCSVHVQGKGECITYVLCI